MALLELITVLASLDQKKKSKGGAYEVVVVEFVLVVLETEDWMTVVFVLEIAKKPAAKRVLVTLDTGVACMV